MARFVVSRRIPEPALDLLRAEGETWVSDEDRPLEPNELRERAGGAAALITLLHDQIDGALMDAAGPQLRCVANVAVGYDNVDLEAAAERGVVVTNTPGVLTDSTADLAFALILMSTRRLGEGERQIRAGKPWEWHMFHLLGTAIRGRRLGIVGLGAIGAAVARRARAFGMEIAYSQRSAADPALETELSATQLELDELLRTADVVSLHCPLTDETRHLIDARALGLMRGSAYLVNTARGPIVDESALAEALAAGTIRGAGLDVFEHEPRVSEGLLELENAVLIPHLGSATVETRTAMAGLAARNAIAVSAGGAPLTPVGAR